MQIKLVAGSLMIFIAAGCVSTNAALVDPSVRFAQTCPEAVRLYTSVDQISSPYMRVALLNSVGKTDEGATNADIIRSMRKKAAKIGANGLLLQPIEDPGPLVTIIGQVAKTGTEIKGNAVAIYVPADSAKTRSACGSK